MRSPPASDTLTPLPCETSCGAGCNSVSRKSDERPERPVKREAPDSAHAFFGMSPYRRIETQWEGHCVVEFWIREGLYGRGRLAAVLPQESERGRLRHLSIG